MHPVSLYMQKFAFRALCSRNVDGRSIVVALPTRKTLSLLGLFPDNPPAHFWGRKHAHSVGKLMQGENEPVAT